MRRVLRTSSGCRIARQHMIGWGHSSPARVCFGDNVKHTALRSVTSRVLRILIYDLQLVDLSLLVVFAVSGEHLREIGIKDSARSHIAKDIFSAKLRH